MAHEIATIIPVTILCGMSAGAFVALIGAPATKMGGPTSVGERTGLLFSFTSLGALLGPPISGAIRKSSGNWQSVGNYAGTCALLQFLH
jgi:MCP family monocarboxylic acid transporter-like MFS transporter 10